MPHATAIPTSAYAREGASFKADAAARALREAKWPQRVRVLDGVRPPPSLCGACVAADCGTATQGELDALNLANVAWAFATADRSDALLFAALARAAERRLGEFNA